MNDEGWSPDSGGDLTAELLPPLSEAATVALREWGLTEPVLLAGDGRRETATVGELAAVIELRSSDVGPLVVNASKATSLALARRVVSQGLPTEDSSSQPAELATLAEDCLGEMANVVAGQTKTMLFGTGHHFLLTPPRIVRGPEVVGTRPLECLVLVFATEVGEVTVQLFLERAGA